MPRPTRPTRTARRTPALRRALATALLLAAAGCDRPRDAVLLYFWKSGSQETLTLATSDLIFSRVVWSDGPDELVVVRDWVSSAPTVARVEPCLEVTGHMCVFGYAAGEVTITGTYEGASASQTWTVTP